MLSRGRNVGGESHSESHTRVSRRASQCDERERVRRRRDAGILKMSFESMSRP